MWSVILETYENANQAHIGNLIFALTNIKHQSHVDPFITVEKFNEIRRQLIRADCIIPEEFWIGIK